MRFVFCVESQPVELDRLPGDETQECLARFRGAKCDGGATVHDLERLIDRKGRHSSANALLDPIPPAGIWSSSA